VEAPFTELRGEHLIRVSFQAYNDERDLERLLEALRALFA
jgi:selenocysteine lyase/cysteine desulfurase